jgi:Co/Zn/Cd efflux system component
MSDSCCEQELNVRALHAGQRRVLKIVLAINAATFVMIVAAALYSGSTSLLSGGLDNLGDALTYALSLAVVGASTQAKSRVALFKGALILSAGVAVGVRIAWRVLHPEVPLLEAMTGAAVLNLIANAACLRLLIPYRHDDIIMGSVWECSPGKARATTSMKGSPSSSRLPGCGCSKPDGPTWPSQPHCW